MASGGDGRSDERSNIRTILGWRRGAGICFARVSVRHDEGVLEGPHVACAPEEREVTPAGFVVSSVRVVNGSYGELRSKFNMAKERVSVGGARHDLLTDQWVKDRDAGHNEWLLLHGTSERAAGLIEREGFSLALAISGGTCGKAFYFAESSTKADG